MTSPFTVLVEKELPVRNSPFSDLVESNRATAISPLPQIDYNNVLDFSSRFELPPEDVEGIYGPLNTMTRAVTDPQEMDFGLSTLSPQENLKIGAPTGKEKKTFLESILGFTYPAHPFGWKNASPIEKFNFATLPISDFLGRIGGKIASDWRLTKKEDVQKILVSEYHDTLKWYQKSPELAGWAGEQIAEYAVLRTIFAVSGLSNVLTGAGQKISQPFITKAISAGGPELKTLSGAGIRNLLRQGLVNFLQAAPENTAFVGSWSGLDSALKGNLPKQIALDAAKGMRWALGLTAGLAFLAPLVKTPEVQGAFQQAAAYLARKYPRTIDFLSKDIEPEIVDQTVKAYGKHIGQDIRFTELPANVQVGVRNAARALKKELIKAAQKEDALKTYLTAKLAREAREAGAIIPGFISEEAKPFGEVIEKVPIIVAPVAEAIITPPPITLEQEVFSRIESPTGKIKPPPTIAARPPVAAVGVKITAEPTVTAPKTEPALISEFETYKKLIPNATEKEVAQMAAEDGVILPDEILEKYEGESWADEQLDTKRNERIIAERYKQQPAPAIEQLRQEVEKAKTAEPTVTPISKKELRYIQEAPAKPVGEKPYEIQEWAKQFHQDISFNKDLEWDYSHRAAAGTEEIFVGTKGLSANDIKLVTLHEIGHNVADAEGTFHPEIKDTNLRREVDATEWALQTAGKQGIDTSNAIKLFTSKITDLTKQAPAVAKEEKVPPGMKPGFVELPPQLQDIADSIKENVQAIAKDVGDLVKSLEFYPDLPNDLRNDIRVDVVGAIDRARDDVYDKIAKYLWGKMKQSDVQKSVEIIFARDQVSRTQLGKGNPEIGLEDAYAFLDMAMEDASPEVIAAADKWRTINQKFRDKLVQRGLLDEEQLIEDYAPHYVLDYTPDWKFNVGIPTRLKRPFRGYIKKAYGTKKEYQQDKDALLGSLLIQQHDNIIEDFIEKQCEKYDILATLSKEQKTQLFGKDKAGRVNTPKPGRIYDIGGKRYRAYTPDIPFTRQLFPTEDGLMAMGRYKNVSLIPEQIYNLFKEFSERGSRSVYLINRATSIWKSMAILSHFPSFNINNIVGDTWMAMVQHPDPLRLMTEIPTAIQYISGRGAGSYFERLHKFLIEQNILSGTFAASEMAQMRTSKNPIAWLLEKTQEFSNAREAIMRVAYASTLLKAQETGEATDMIKAHDWIDTEDLAEDAALGKIAREVLVDYQATSKTFKRFIRGAVAPFATWYVKGSKLMWSWAAKHWGKALAVFMGVPIAAEVYNHRTDEINGLEKQLPDYVRNRTHLVLGENADGTIRVWSFQLPQDALIGTKIFSILTDYANRVYNKEMTPKEAALQCLRTWGIKEAKGLAFLTAPLIRYFGGLMTSNHRDPYDGAPIYATDPAKMTWFDRKKDESLFFLKTMVPFLSVSIGAYEKGQPTDLALKNLLDRFAGKGALGIYDTNKQGKLIIERNGQKFEFDYDDVARIQYIAAKEERYLDKIERSFIGGGLSPDKFVDTSLCYNQLDKIYDLWSKFEPSLEKQQWTSNQEKARAIMGKLGERFTNRLVDMLVIKKWYNVKLARADTDAEKIVLRKELEQIQSVQMIETLKRLPQSARTLGINAVFQKSELPWELILTLP